MPSPSGDDADDPNDDEVYCRDCGAIISKAAEMCPDCGVRQRAPPAERGRSVLDGGNEFVAAACSTFVPGLGQLYNRDLEGGLAFAAAAALAVLSTAFGIGLLLYPVVWLYAIYDAYTHAPGGHPNHRVADRARD